MKSDPFYIDDQLNIPKFLRRPYAPAPSTPADAGEAAKADTWVSFTPTPKPTVESVGDGATASGGVHQRQKDGPVPKAIRRRPRTH